MNIDHFTYVYIYISLYHFTCVCMYVCTYVRTYVCMIMYVCMSINMYGPKYPKTVSIS